MLLHYHVDLFEISQNLNAACRGRSPNYTTQASITIRQKQTRLTTSETYPINVHKKRSYFSNDKRLPNTTSLLASACHILTIKNAPVSLCAESWCPLVTHKTDAIYVCFSAAPHWQRDSNKFKLFCVNQPLRSH